MKPSDSNNCPVTLHDLIKAVLEGCPVHSTYEEYIQRLTNFDPVVTSGLWNEFCQILKNSDESVDAVYRKSVHEMFTSQSEIVKNGVLSKQQTVKNDVKRIIEQNLGDFEKCYNQLRIAYPPQVSPIAANRRPLGPVAANPRPVAPVTSSSTLDLPTPSGCSSENLPGYVPDSENRDRRRRR